MRFQGAGIFEQGVVDVNPSTHPTTILPGHFISFKSIDRKVTEDPEALYLLLIGAGVETLTVDLWALVEDQDKGSSPTDYMIATTRWFKFAAAVVITNGTLQKVTAALPAGGVIYAQRTADSFGAGLSYPLLAAWVAAKQ